MILADIHTHTSFSTDSDAAPEAMLASAVERGLTTYCITDHMDYLFPMDETAFLFDPKAYFSKMTALREEWSDRIDLRIGVELGLRDEPDVAGPVRDYYEKLLRDYPFDFVIGSTHCVCHTDPYYPDYWQTRIGTEGVLRYLEAELWNMEHYDGFHVCGHLDYILRYVPKNRRVHRSKLNDVIEAILQTLLRRGIGLEINSGSLRRNYPDFNPSAAIAARYYELGGRLITIGSDAHYAEHVAADFDRAEAMLTAIGFDSYATFRSGKPIFQKFSDR
ncbi:MAG: histidinol-phosphatase HisJ family protein [Lachnospiraceae bacterium]|nr:histidinol-phosphatase HisJ family protein [Lachnospiraceae bacterium]